MLYVFDRRKLFIGSPNFDERSRGLNTEIGLFIDSPVLAQQAATRFQAMASLQNSYHPALRTQTADGLPQLLWRTREDGQLVEHEFEPTDSVWRQLQVGLLSLLLLDGEL